MIPASVAAAATRFASEGYALHGAHFPEDLVFYVNYLGGEAPTATLNFSKGAATVLMQYYQILRLGQVARLVEVDLRGHFAVDACGFRIGQSECLADPAVVRSSAP